MREKEQGFTLLEVVIAMTLLGIVLMVGNQLLFSGLKSWIDGEEQIDVVQNMRVGMDFLTSDIRSAIEVRTVSSSSNYIVMFLPNADFSSIKEVHYRYDAVDKELERKEGSSSFQPVSSRISGLSFTYTGNPVKFVGITLKGKRKDGYEITLKSKVTLRSVR